MMKEIKSKTDRSKSLNDKSRVTGDCQARLCVQQRLVYSEGKGSQG